jgi:hypothetical protein
MRAGGEWIEASARIERIVGPRARLRVTVARRIRERNVKALSFAVGVGFKV